MSDITDRQWNSLIWSITHKKCILFLGPGISVNYNNRNSMEMIFEEITRKPQESSDVAFHKNDNLLIFKDRNAVVGYRPTVVEFFKKDFSNELLEKLVEIPFHLIISVTPDHTISNIFEKNKYKYQKSYFSKEKKVEYDIKEVPLIYNLFGDIDDEMSIIFSHHDLFEYLDKGWVNSSYLPETIKTSFNKENTSNIIFLGFEFDKWYYQFILYLFKLDYEGCLRYAFQEAPCSEMITLCQSNYQISFINREMKDFVTKLYQDFPKNELRKPCTEAEKQKKWKKEKFIIFLSKAMSSTEWDTFCLTHFYEVFKDFTDNQDRSKQINNLIDYVACNGKFQNLSDLCKEFNQVSFNKQEPYYE
jgi:hypothetical protein